MATKKIDQPIEGIDTPWEGYIGSRVEAFIKEQLKGKAGVFHYDTANNRYMVFADVADKEAYLADPQGEAARLIGVFDAPFNYTATITLATPTYNAVLLGDTPPTVRFTFDVVNKSGQSVGEDVTATYTLTRGATRYSKTERLRYGTTGEFDPSEWLAAGTSTLTIGITGVNTLAATTVAVTIQVVDLKLTDELDISKTVQASAVSAPLEIPYTLSGYGVKMMEWYVDGEKVPAVKVEDELTQSSATRTKTLSLANLSAGAHSVQYRAFTEIDGQRFYSPTLYREVMVVSSQLTDTLVAVALRQPSGTPIVSPTDTLEMSGLVQYQEAKITYAAYSPTGRPVEVSVKLGGEVVSRSNVANGSQREVVFTPTVSGAQSLVITAGGTARTISAPVEATPTALHEITNALLLGVDAKGRTNSDADRGSWDYGELTAVFSGLQWNARSGWDGEGALCVPSDASVSWGIAPLAEDVTRSGMTLEMDIEATDVADDDAVLLDLLSEEGKGIKITASQALVTSDINNSAATASVRYKAGEAVRLSLVIRRQSGETYARTASVYVDGIHSACFGYGNSPRPFQCGKTLAFSPQSGAGVKIRSVRLYGTALSDDDVLNNYELYRPTPSEMLVAVRRNNLLAEGSDDLDTNALLGHTPVMIVTGDVSQVEATTNKKFTMTVDVEYTDVEDPTRSFTMENATLGGQGTSSMLYPRKNFRLYTKKSDATVVKDWQGNVVEDKLLSFHSNAIPVGTWCLKADYAESSSTHNTGIARLWNAAMRDAAVYVGGSPTYPLRTKAQEAARKAGYPYDVRTAVDGFPIVMFYRLTKDSPLIFLGKYNFNNDKSTENVFGFRDIPGFDNSKVECWECLDNAHPLALMSSYTDADWAAGWSGAFEGRYPDGNTDTTALRKLVKHVATQLQPTYEGLSAVFDLPKLLAYYIYAMRFGAVDQLVKNSMLTTEDGVHWYFINYDNDTVLGLDNDGIVAFSPDIDRQSVDPRVATSYCYAGHSSKLWNTVEQAIEEDAQVASLLKEVDQSLYVAGLKYSGVLDMFETQQSSKWPERVYNRDAQYKYLLPWLDGLDHLPKLQGSRKSHRRWWLSKRFSLYDSRWVTGDYAANVVSFKCYDAPAGTKFKITSGRKLYYGYAINNVVKEAGVELAPGESHAFTVADPLPIGNPVKVYAAPDLRGLVLSGFYPWLADVNLQGAYTDDLGTSLTVLKLGTATAPQTSNQTLTAVSGLQRMSRLEELDLRNLSGISSLDLSRLGNLRTARLEGTTVQSAVFAEGAPLETVGLPGTCTRLVLCGCEELEFSGISQEGGLGSLKSVTVRGCPKLRNSWRWLQSCTGLESAEIEDADWTGISAAQLIGLVGRVESLTMTGKAALTDCTVAQYETIRSLLGKGCFDADAPFRVIPPLMIVGPDTLTVVAGRDTELPLSVVPETAGRWGYAFSSGFTGSVSNGRIVTPTTLATGDYTLTATFTPTGGGSSVSKTVTLSVQGLVAMTGCAINGPEYIDGSAQLSLEVRPANCNAQYTTAWSVTSGTAEITGATKTGCTITPSSARITVKAVVTDETGGSKQAVKSFDCVTEALLADTADIAMGGGTGETVTAGSIQGGILGYTVGNQKHFAYCPPNGSHTFEISAGAGSTVKLVNAARITGLTVSAQTATAANLGKATSATSIDLSDTSVSSLTMPSSVSQIATLKLPDTVTEVDVRGMGALQTLECSSALEVFKWNSATSHIDGYTKAKGFASLQSLTLEGINATDGDLSAVARWAQLSDATVSGAISVNSCSPRHLASVQSAFPNLTVTYGILEPERDGSMIIKVQKGSQDAPFSLYLKADASIIEDCSVDWGDSNDGAATITFADEGVTHLTHTYNDNDPHYVRIYSVDKITDVSFVPFSTDNESYDLYVRAFVTAGSCNAFVHFGQNRYGCRNLVAVSEDLFSKQTSPKDFSRVFAGCGNLTTIPENLFDGCHMQKVTSMFYSCGITAIPEGLFHNCTVDSFAFCFQCAPSLTTIPEGLFSGKNQVTDFNSLFIECTGLANVPTSIFSDCTAATNFSKCFCDCSSLTSVPEGLFSSNTAATNFSQCFWGCSSLTSVPEGLFASNTAATNFLYCFRDTGLTVIPGKLFKFNTAATNFQGCFQNTNIGFIPATLFQYNTAATSFSQCFMQCPDLTALPRGLFKFATSAYNYAQVAYMCPSLTSAYFPEAFSSSKRLNTASFIGNSNTHYTLYVTQTVPPSLGSGDLGNILDAIHVPTASVNAYKTATNWSAYADKIVGDSTLNN